MKKKLSVKQLECKLTAYPAKLPVLAAHKNSEIKDMRANAVSHFQIRLKMWHGKGADIDPFILYITSILHQMPQDKERSLIREMLSLIHI